MKIVKISTFLSILVLFAPVATRAELSLEEKKQADSFNNVFRRAVLAVQPSVVCLKVQRPVYQINPYSPPSSGSSVGSGCIIDRRGYVITNNHVVAGSISVEVVLPDGVVYIAKDILLDPDTDLALVKIDPGKTELPVAVFGDSANAQVGDFVMAMGSPFGLEQTVTMGIISFKGRKTNILGQWGYEEFLQTDTAINKGNSGGPLVNLRGEIIGINANIFTQTGMNAGYGFAVPSKIAKKVANELIQNKYVRRGYLGIGISRTSLDELRQMDFVAQEPRNIDEQQMAILQGKLPKFLTGTIVGSVSENSPALKAEMKAYDVIVKFNKLEPENSDHLRKMIADSEPESDVTITVWRDGKFIELLVKLDDRRKVQLGFTDPEEITEILQKKTVEKPDGSALGIPVRAITQELVKLYGFEKGTTGLMVTRVREDSLAYKAGIKGGDIITKANGQLLDGNARGKDNLRKIIEDADLKEGLKLQVKRASIGKETQILDFIIRLN
ncbi:MAG: trypsin-like peptidase domain-containing protein [Phycisphaerae bacterium]|nr:trypsin-like peptidase domain-containing protein [Phycisphaerae bacterium]